MGIKSSWSKVSG